MLVRVDRADKIWPGNTEQVPVQSVGPKVVATCESRCVSLIALAKQIAAMPAGVDEAAELAVFAAHNEVGLVEYSILLPVSRSGQLVHSSRDLPHAHPDCFALALLKVG
jgi:hypothetical protein